MNNTKKKYFSQKRRPPTVSAMSAGIFKISVFIGNTMSAIRRLFPPVRRLNSRHVFPPCPPCSHDFNNVLNLLKESIRRFNRRLRRKLLKLFNQTWREYYHRPAGGRRPPFLSVTKTISYLQIGPAGRRLVNTCFYLKSRPRTAPYYIRVYVFLKKHTLCNEKTRKATHEKG